MGSQFCEISSRGLLVGKCRFFFNKLLDTLAFKATLIIYCLNSNKSETVWF